MRKLIFIVLIFPSLIFASSLSFDSFVSNFTEKIYDSDTTQIAKIVGKIYIKKPGLLRMDVKFPQKQLMIVRGDSAMIMIENTKQVTFSVIPKNNSWLIPSNILFNNDSMFNVKNKNDTFVMIPRDSLIPLDSITVNAESPIRFMSIYTKDQTLKFFFSRQKINKKLNRNLFLFPKKKNSNK